MRSTPEGFVLPQRWHGRWVGRRGIAIGLLATLGLCVLMLGADSIGLPGDDGWGLVGRIASAAITPSLDPAVTARNAPPGWRTAGEAVWLTVVFAVGAVSLAGPAGLALACGYRLTEGLTDQAWSLRMINSLCRVAIGGGALMVRSIHELLWAVILLCMVGLTPLTAVLAIAVPYTGIFAKVFGDILSETPRGPSNALERAGAGPMQTLLVGTVGSAKPMLISYGLYRFECALRSAAVLGFFGLTTLGYHIRLAFDNADYSMMWAYLYLLVGLLAAAEGLSALLGRALR